MPKRKVPLPSVTATYEKRDHLEVFINIEFLVYYMDLETFPQKGLSNYKPTDLHFYILWFIASISIYSIKGMHIVEGCILATMPRDYN